MREEEKDGETEGLVQKTADELFQRMQKGENVSLPVLLEGIVNAVMERERDYFLQSTEDYSNGFYTRKLQLAMGRLNLKVPRVRHSKGWRPALFPARWGRVYGDYGQILTALMVNGYSQRQMMDSLRELNLPYSQCRWRSRSYQFRRSNFAQYYLMPSIVQSSFFAAEKRPDFLFSFSLYDSPLMLITTEWCSTLSRTADAMVSSPSISAHSEKRLLLVYIVDAVSYLLETNWKNRLPSSLFRGR